MIKQFVNIEDGSIVFIDHKDKEYKKYSKSKDWKQVWNLVVE